MARTPGRRLPTGVAAFVRVFAIPLALLTLAAASARSDVKLELSPGFDAAYRPGTWTPLVLHLTGAPSNTPAQIEVQVRTRMSGAVTYLQPVNLHSGGSDRFTVYYEHPDSFESPEISVRVIANGRAIAEKKLDGGITIAEGQPLVLGLTQDQSGLNYLGQIDLGVQHKSGPAAPNPYGNLGGGASSPTPSKNPARVLYPRVSTLPTSSFAYRSVDAIVLGDAPIDSFDEGQWRALTTWVSDGGLLIVSGGSDLNRARNPLLAPLLPIKVNSVRQARSLPSLAEVYGASPVLTSAALLSGPLVPDATALCTDAGQPTIALRRYGRGTVVLTAFDLMAPEFRAWTGQERFWQDVMQRGTRGFSVTAAMKSAVEPARWQPWMGNVGSSQQLTDALAGVQSVEAPPFQMIGLFLLAYIICLVPMNYLLLKRLDRKELAWITAPVIILVFSVGAYAQGYRIKGGQLYLRACSVVEGSAGSASYDSYTFASIFSPRQDRYTVSVSDPNAIAKEVAEGAGFQSAPPGDIEIDRDQRTSVKDALVNMWDHRSFALSSHVDLGGTISTSIEQAAAGQANIHLANGTSHTLSDCAVSFRGIWKAVGTLKPGDTKTVSLGLTGNAANGLLPDPGGVSGGTKNEAAIRTALFNILSQFQTLDPATGQVTGPLVLTGWFEDNVTGVRLEGEQPRQSNVNLLVVHLPTPGGYAAAPRPIIGTPLNGSGGGFGGVRRAPQFVAPPPVAAMPNAGTANDYNNLAYSYANQGRLDLAMNAANQALKLAPQDGNILDSVAEMHQRRKEYKVAASYYALALSRQQNGGLTETHEKYGETLIMLGDQANGIRHLQTAAKDSASPYGAKAAQKLQQLGFRPAPPSRQTF